MREEDYKEWFRFADMDLETARHLFEKMYPPPLEIICFHCQQAAEKFIKGVLVYCKIEVIKTHDLVVLIDRLKGRFAISQEVLIACARLIPYGVSVRYPQDLNVDESTVKASLHYATIIKDWAMGLLEK